MKIIQWSEIQRLEAEKIIRAEQQRRLTIIQEELAQQRRKIAEDLERA